MLGEFSNIKIQGIAVAVPSCIEDNSIFENVLGARRLKKQIKLTGVRQRHISTRKQRTSDLCYIAASKLLKQLEWDVSDIKALIFVTQRPNYVVPSTAFFLQKRLGVGTDCVVFDINLGCSSFNVGVHTISALLQNCNVSDKALLLIGDTLGNTIKPGEKINESTIANRLLFGSAGAAIAIEKVVNEKLCYMTKSNGNGYDAIIRHLGEASSHMDGEAVFQFAINNVSEDVNYFKKHFTIEDDDIDFYIFHQAQKLILDNIADACNIPEGKELRSLEQFGNTSGTSVAVSICANIDKLKKKDNVKLLLCGFGVGLSWGMVYSNIPTKNILPIIVTDEHFDEDKSSQGQLKNNNVLVLHADSDMGQIMTWCLDNAAACIYLKGSNINEMNQIEKSIFNMGESFCKKEEIIDYCKENKMCFDGIVCMNQKEDIELIRALLDSDVLDRSVSLVLLSEIENNQNEQEIKQCKEHLEIEMLKLDKLLADVEGRVNSILFAKDLISVVPYVADEQKWSVEFIEKLCPDEMLRPLKICESTRYLLSDESEFITNSIIKINL